MLGLQCERAIHIGSATHLVRKGGESINHSRTTAIQSLSRVRGFFFFCQNN